MARRYFNWKLAVVLVLGVVVIAVAAVALRRWQRATRADRALPTGIKAYNEQRWDEAAANLGRYLAIKSDDIPTLLKYADAQLKIRPAKAGHIQQAIAAYRSVLRLDGSNSEAAQGLAEIYLDPRIRSPGEAELITRRYLENNKNPSLRRMLAVALAAQRKFEEAQSELTTLVKENPDQVLAYEMLGLLAKQRPKDPPDPPAFWFDQTVSNNPSSALAYVIRAGFYLRTNEPAKALADLEHAEKLDLSDSKVRLRLAAELIDANAPDKAKEHLTAVQQITPTDQMLWQTWAELARRSRSKEEMLTVAETGLKALGSQPWDFLPTAAELFMAAGQPDQAADCVSKMRQKDILPAYVAFIEGLIFEYKGEFARAIEAWSQAIKLGYKDEHGHAHPRARLKVAFAYSRLGDNQSAIVQLRSLVSDDPDVFDGHLVLARLLALTRNWSEASEEARKALELSPENPEAAFLNLQARMQVLASGQVPPDRTALTWDDISKQLSSLEKSTKGAIEVKFLQVQGAMLQGKLAEARDLVTKLRQEHPTEPRVAMFEVELLTNEGKQDQVASLLAEMIERFPQAVEPVLGLALLLDRQNNRDKYESVMKDALARMSQPSNKRYLGLLLAARYASWNQRDKQYEILSRLDQELPNDIKIKRGLLACEQISKNRQESQKLVDQIKSLEGQTGWQWRYEQAKAWFNPDDFKNQYTQILSLLQENLLANPQDQTSRLLLAAAYERAGELQLAISTYREALNRSPDDAAIIFPTAAALYKAREYDQAEELLKRAAQQGLSHPGLQQLQLQDDLRRGQLGSAADILQDLAAQDPNNVSTGLRLAAVLAQQKKFAEAGALLDKLRTREPNSPVLIVAQVQLNIQQKKPEEALRLCNEAAKNPSNAFPYMLRARTYAALQQTDKAIEDFGRAISVEPNNVNVWVARSNFFRTMGRMDEAVADMQHALSLAPGDIRVQKLAISTLIYSGDSAKIGQARAILDKALQASPDDVELRLYKARVLLLFEGTAPAIENAQNILRTLTDSNPGIAEAWGLSAEILLGQGDPGKAVDVALRGLAYKPNDRGLLLLKARAEEVRSPVLAVPTLRILAEQDPNDVEVAVRLAQVYIKAGEPEKAAELLRKRLQVSDASSRRRYEIILGAALYKSGKKSDAQVLFDTLLQSQPDDPAPLLALTSLLGQDKLWSQVDQRVIDWSGKHPNDNRTPVAVAGVLTDMGDTQARQTAEAILRRTLERSPNSSAVAGALAMLLQAAGRAAESAQLYQKILEADPNNVVAINNLAWILCEERGECQQALDLAGRGIKLAPQYIDLLDTRGVAYYRLGQHEKAVRDFTECVRLYPGNVPSSVTSRFHLARALTQLGRKTEAAQQLEQVLDLHKTIGGLSQADVAEAQRLLEQLKKGG